MHSIPWAVAGHMLTSVVTESWSFIEQSFCPSCCTIWNLFGCCRTIAEDWIVSMSSACDGYAVSCHRSSPEYPTSMFWDIVAEVPLSKTHQKIMMKLYSAVTKLPDDSPIRRLTCEPGSDQPRIWNQNRRRGRPKQQWSACVYALLLRARGS